MPSGIGYMGCMAAPTETETVEAAIRAAAAQAGSLRRWAAEHAISYGYVQDVLGGRRPASDRILAALDLERRVVPRRQST